MADAEIVLAETSVGSDKPIGRNQALPALVDGDDDARTVEQGNRVG